MDSLIKGIWRIRSIKYTQHNQARNINTRKIEFSYFEDYICNSLNLKRLCTMDELPYILIKVLQKNGDMLEIREVELKYCSA